MFLYSERKKFKISVFSLPLPCSHPKGWREGEGGGGGGAVEQNLTCKTPLRSNFPCGKL